MYRPEVNREIKPVYHAPKEVKGNLYVTPRTNTTRLQQRPAIREVKPTPKTRILRNTKGHKPGMILLPKLSRMSGLSISTVGHIVYWVIGFLGLVATMATLTSLLVAFHNGGIMSGFSIAEKYQLMTDACMVVIIPLTVFVTTYSLAEHFATQADEWEERQKVRMGRNR